MGDVGMINQQPFHVRDLDSIAGCVKHSNVVINLLGKQELTRNFDLFGSNVEATHNIARVSKEMGVEHFVHISAVAADENSPSEFLRRKAEAEAKVLEYYPNATILRTNVMFAEEDRFLNLIAKWGKIFGFVLFTGERIVDESLLGHLWLIKITSGHARTTNIQFARATNWHGLVLLR